MGTKTTSIKVGGSTCQHNSIKLSFSLRELFKEMEIEEAEQDQLPLRNSQNVIEVMRNLKLEVDNAVTRTKEKVKETKRKEGGLFEQLNKMQKMQGELDKVEQKVVKRSDNTLKDLQRIQEAFYNNNEVR